MQDSNLEKFIPYVGLNYRLGSRSKKLMDCWGLVIFIYKDLYDIDLPAYSDCPLPRKDRERTSGYISNTDLYAQCQTVSIEHCQEADIIILNTSGIASHVGLIIDKDHMIHCLDKSGSVIESHRSLKWKNRVHSVHRHPHFI